MFKDFTKGFSYLRYQNAFIFTKILPQNKLCIFFYIIKFIQKCFLTTSAFICNKRFVYVDIIYYNTQKKKKIFRICCIFTKIIAVSVFTFSVNISAFFLWLGCSLTISGKIFEFFIESLFRILSYNVDSNVSSTVSSKISREEDAIFFSKELKKTMI